MWRVPDLNHSLVAFKFHYAKTQYGIKEYRLLTVGNNIVILISCCLPRACCSRVCLLWTWCYCSMTVKHKATRFYNGRSKRESSFVLHDIFSNKRTNPYGAAAYICVKDKSGNVKTSLWNAKENVAPLKTVGNLILELMAAVVATKIGVYIKNNG